MQLVHSNAMIQVWVASMPAKALPLLSFKFDSTSFVPERLVSDQVLVASVSRFRKFEFFWSSDTGCVKLATNTFVMS